MTPASNFVHVGSPDQNYTLALCGVALKPEDELTGKPTCAICAEALERNPRLSLEPPGLVERVRLFFGRAS